METLSWPLEHAPRPVGGSVVVVVVGGTVVVVGATVVGPAEVDSVVGAAVVGVVVVAALTAVVAALAGGAAACEVPHAPANRPTARRAPSVRPRREPLAARESRRADRGTHERRGKFMSC
jgi:hypothetical protein